MFTRRTIAPAALWQRTLRLSSSQDNDEDFSESDEDIDEQSSGSSRLKAEAKPPAEPSTAASLPANATEKKRKLKAADKENVAGGGNHQTSKKNRFLNALMHAAISYSMNLRTPLAHLVNHTLLSGRHARAHSMVDWNHEFDYTDDAYSSDEETTPATDLPSRPGLSAEQTGRLLYTPHSRWAPYAHQAIEDTKVIAKLNAGAMCEAFIKEGTLGGRRITYISKTWVLSQRWEGFFSEIALYADPQYLRPLQGDVVPMIIGVHLVEGRVSVAMELPHSSFWVEASEDMPDQLKRKCIAAFDKIHTRGVLHNDVELRHMLINAEGNVTVIDFQLSQTLVSNAEVGIVACTEDDIRLEKRKVKFKLNFEDAMHKENSKRKRVIQRQTRNAERRRRQQLKILGQYDGPISDLEADDPDDIDNPIVEPQIWMDCWVSDEFIPSCYVVPGQDPKAVNAALRQFALDVTSHALSNPHSLVPSGSANGTSNNQTSSSITHQNPDDAVNLRKRKHSSSETAIYISSDDESSSAPPPNKRKISPGNDGTLNASIPRRRRHLVGSAIITGCIQPSTTSGETSYDVRTSVVEDVTLPRTTVYEGSEISAQPVHSSTPEYTAVSDSTHRCKSSETIHVPYEGYDGPDGYVAPNQYSDEELAKMRKIWIVQDNIDRCRQEGLAYPLGQKMGLTASTDGSGGSKRQSNGKRLIVSRGALKRMREDEEDPHRAQEEAIRKKARSTAMFERRKRVGSDVADIVGSDDDGSPSGPKILTKKEFEEHNARRIELSAARPAQRRSALRSRLTEAEKHEQRAYEEGLKHDEEGNEEGKIDAKETEVSSRPNLRGNPFLSQQLSGATKSPATSSVSESFHGQATLVGAAQVGRGFSGGALHPLLPFAPFTSSSALRTALSTHLRRQLPLSGHAHPDQSQAPILSHHLRTSDHGVGMSPIPSRGPAFAPPAAAAASSRQFLEPSRMIRATPLRSHRAGTSNSARFTVAPPPARPPSPTEEEERAMVEHVIAVEPIMTVPSVRTGRDSGLFGMLRRWL